MNLTLLTDFYELTMMQGYFKSYDRDGKVIFDFFYRTNPCDGSYSIAAGLEQVIDYINNLNFSPEDIQYLREQKIFEEDFLDYLSHFKFTGDIYSVPEGTVIFPNEPVMKIIAPIMEAQIIETGVLNIMNHQSLIATKASRVKWSAKDNIVLEFGLRRAQGPDAGIYGARAAVIGGCSGTSNVLAGKLFDVPVKGTHAHSWVMSYDDELTAFRTYANLYPDACLLLVDTYDTIRTGVPNAIKVFKELKEKGIKPKLYGIRLDSGDLAYLSKKARKMLDNAGFEDAVISASSDLDEYLIQDLKSQGAEITVWGVGTNLITSKDCPAFGGVYKLSAISKGDTFEPKIKVSENPEKITNPGNKKIYRVYDKDSGKIKADLIALDHEDIKETEPLLLFDPKATWKRMILKPGTFTLRELLIPIFIKGHCVYNSPKVMDIQKYCFTELESLWPETRRIINPQYVYVDLTTNLYNLKQEMIERFRETEI
ncbi:nicotinate phosphoribosyltransferase [Natranaerovirga pectinivora]|uniref:Nicotinate phosphoribosyltransferase n=1 Tax=Natranaerovirga pectinivora TaxID=682400 RepID=A0A4R3MJS7_9FIRM|nr:nicotinate phosphoribosyltransferase [Natranaerovirga pectinivora]TCT13994.1 nicotinate phosphoribosyltransferase [Natranaerovirga pectinivora]